MNFKRLACALMCALIAISGMALAEGDKDARIAELERQVADLAAQVEEYHRKELVAEFDGGEVLLSDALEQYAYYESMYAQYGISLADYGMEQSIKEQIANSMVEEQIVRLMADKLGLSVSDEVRASLEKESSEAYEGTVRMYYEQYLKETSASEEEGMAAAAEALKAMGYSYDDLLDNHLKSYLSDAVYTHVTKDVAVTDEDVQKAYDAQLAEDQAGYENDPSAYESARTSGTMIAWNPEGYRAVKHILFKFNDEQAQRYSTLVQQRSALEKELAAAAPAETAEAAEPTEATEPTESAEPAEAAREVSAIEGDLANTNAQIDALYEELMPEVESAVARFENGEDINALIAELNDDTGMTDAGYPVTAASTTWDPAFTAGAMSIAEVGGISEPVRGIYGVHLVYYMADIPAGPVALDDLRDQISENALAAKLSETYAAQMDAWKAELNVQMYLENF